MGELRHVYQFVTVKSFDSDRRVITGIATTGEPDRMDDVVDPLGAKFSESIPLLLYHDSRLPVGNAKLGRATSAGISFEATIPTIPEPGRLRDRVDEAWDSIRAGLIKGVSIGFRVIGDNVERIKDGGLLFKKFEILELSLVAVPANASASISTFKSLCTAEPVLSDGARGAVRSSPAVVGSRVVASKAPGPMKTITDQISSFEATRQAKAAERNDLMTKASEAGLTLDHEQTEQYDMLNTEIKGIDAHLVRLRDLETEQKATAKPVNGASPNEAIVSRSPHAVQVKSNLPPGMIFTRFVICKAVAFLSQGSQTAMEIAKERYPDQSEIPLMLKAAVGAGTTLDSNYAAQLAYAQDDAAAFLEWLRPQTIVGRLQGLTRVPFNVRYGTQTSGGTANWVGQAKPKPLTSFTFGSGTLGITKLAAIAALADELVMLSSPNAETLVRQSLADAIIQQLDLDFIDPGNAGTSNVKPASITNGVTPLVSAGTSSDNAITDLGKLLKVIIEAKLNPTQIALVMPATLSMSLGLMTNSLGQLVFPDAGADGGKLRGLQIIATQQAAFTTNYGNIVVAIHTPSIYMADDGSVKIDVSRDASLEMLDGSLTQDGAAGTGASLVSMFQNNMLAIRAERHINWKKARTAAVQWMSDVNWGSIGSPV